MKWHTLAAEIRQQTSKNLFIIQGSKYQFLTKNKALNAFSTTFPH